MRKIILLLIADAILSIVSAQNTGRLFDQPMKLKNVSIDIQSDAFVATTFIEIEFYNPNGKEIEGLYRFRLNPGQVITAFQLDLNGKYRDGSIEERWKARSAYGNIVGKRMDPALLQYESSNSYRLNIYPVPAGGSRKITMTIQQLLSAEKNELIYNFPFTGNDTAEIFRLAIQVNNTKAFPFIEKGLVIGKNFTNQFNKSHLTWTAAKLLLTGEISFSIPLRGDAYIGCEKARDQKNYYALRTISTIPAEAEITPKKITVCWDVSASASNRNFKKEINFLRSYISYYGVSQITIIPFNYTVHDTATFNIGKNFGNRWENYLESLNNDGATQLGCLDLSACKDDVVFLFSDGKNSFGNAWPEKGATLLYCVNSVPGNNLRHLSEIIGSNGGKIIDLAKITISEGVSQSGKVSNWLMKASSVRGKIICNQLFPIPLDKSILLDGMFSNTSDTLTLYYGHGSDTIKKEKFSLTETECNSVSSIGRLAMLQQFETIQKTLNWEEILEFGLKEKIVTWNTSYIVLEKAEDYIKYNITPPKELEEECNRQMFVKKDTRLQRQQLKQMDKIDILKNVVRVYNDRISKWNENEPAIVLNEENFNQTITGNQNMGPTKKEENTSSSPNTTSTISDKSSRREMELSEVVVTAFGIKRRPKEIGYSITSLRNEQITNSRQPFLGQALSGKVAGLTVYNTNNAVNPDLRIVLRGNRSITGDNQPLIVLDGVSVPSNTINFLNPNDIESVTVLKSGQAAILYGSEGANGVLLINTKKGRQYGYYRSSWPNYKLKDMEEVDYMQEMQKATSGDKLNKYYELRESYGNEPGFYFDVAQYLFKMSLKKEAFDILLNATEISDGNSSILRAIGYTLENWQYFDEAIKVYEQLLESDTKDLYSYRDLAWACYQNGNYQRAIDLLYDAITLNTESGESNNLSFKSLLLDEMNAMISIHKEVLDLSKIPAVLIRPLPSNLRIVLDCNKQNLQNIIIREPGGAECSTTNTVSKNGGFIVHNQYNYYRDNSYYYSYMGPIDYQIRNAREGKYKIRIDYSAHNYYDYKFSGHIPTFIRITSFKDFGNPNQAILIENVNVDNQAGIIEIGEIKWEKDF